MVHGVLLVFQGDGYGGYRRAIFEDDHIIDTLLDDFALHMGELTWKRLINCFRKLK